VPGTDEQRRNGERGCQCQVVGKADAGRTCECEEVSRPSGRGHDVGPRLFRVVSSS